jgi:hypothetical protein
VAIVLDGRRGRTGYEAGRENCGIELTSGGDCSGYERRRRGGWPVIGTGLSSPIGEWWEWSHDAGRDQVIRQSTLELVAAGFEPPAFHS